MIALDAASVLLQWATGGLLFLWVTTRHRLVGIGYGWLLRSTYGFMALGALVLGLRFNPLLFRDVAAAGVVAASALAFLQSYRRREVGVRNQKELAAARSRRVAERTGIDLVARSKAGAPAGAGRPGDPGGTEGIEDTEGGTDSDDPGPEFDPRLDLVAPIVGLIGVVAAGLAGGDPAWLAVARMVTGAVFLGAVSDAMLLGHWYLVQPGLSRGPINELVRWIGLAWFPEVVLLLVPTGMISVLNGTIDDGWAGLLGWFWVASAVTTIGLVGVTVAALRERQYSAVMAATGLLYLAILTGFGTDLVARALLA